MPLAPRGAPSSSSSTTGGRSNNTAAAYGRGGGGGSGGGGGDAGDDAAAFSHSLGVDASTRVIALELELARTAARLDGALSDKVRGIVGIRLGMIGDDGRCIAVSINN